jgi:hypothetical protein
MRTMVVGAVAALSLAALVAAWGGGADVFAQRLPGPEVSAELIALATPAGEHRQQLTLIDSRARVMSVYHVDLTTGVVTLKSVRNFHWDMQMTEFNGVSPLPREIRALLEAR